MRRLLIARVVLAIAVATGCAADRGSGGGASPSTTRPTANDARAVMTAIGRLAPFVDRLGVGRRLVRDAEGFRLVVDEGWRSPGAIEATLPVVANGALRLGVSSHPDFWIELRAEDAARVVGEPIEGAVVFPSACGDADVIHVAEPGRVEEIRLLHTIDVSSTTTLRWNVRRGADVGELSVRDGRVEVRDRSGRVRMASAPVFAVDANGVRREGTIDLDAQDVLTAAIDLRGLTPPIAVDPAWGSTSSMSTVRYRHRSVLLSSGSVLVAGGKVATSSYLATAEIYDPGADTWTPTASMSVPRVYFTLDVLSTGKVLAVGGASTGVVPVATTEIFDPGAGSWSDGTSMSVPRYSAASTVMLDGRVLVTGGVSTSTVVVSSAEVYDPTSGAWTTTGSMTTPRAWHTSTLLKSGKVLIVGGASTPATSDTLASAEIYDPTSGTFTATTKSMSTPRQLHAAIALPSAKVLVVGGWNGANLGSAEVYDPSTNAFTPTTSMSTPRDSFPAALLSTGKVVVAGGSSSGSVIQSSVELWDPSTGKWTATTSMASPRAYLPGALLASGALLVSGGYKDNFTAEALSSAEIYTALVDGTPCTDGAPCASGFCVDHVCCDEECAGGTCGGGKCAPPSDSGVTDSGLTDSGLSDSGSADSPPPQTDAPTDATSDDSTQSLYGCSHGGRDDSDFAYAFAWLTAIVAARRRRPRSARGADERITP